MKKIITLIFILLIALSNIATAGIFDKLDKLDNDRAKAAVNIVKTLISLDEEDEIEIGKTAGISLINKFGLYENAAAVKYINLIGNILAENCERSNLKFHFNILNSESINAYACPGGFIFITLGALKFAESEDEIAGILAHEIAHITLKHEIREIKKSNILKELSELHGQKNREVINRLSNFVLDNLLVKGRSRKDEYEADEHSLNYIKEHNYNAELKNFLARLAQDSGNTEKKSKLEYLTKTHPPLVERIAKLEKKSDILQTDMSKRTARFNYIKSTIAQND